MGMQTKKGFIKKRILTTIILCLIVIVCAAYLLMHKKAIAPTVPIETNTYGMSQYVDSHGFSFWYPKALQIATTITNDDTSFPGGTAVETLQVGDTGGTTIYVVNSTTSTITDEQNGHASPISQTKYSYDMITRQWMVSYPEGTDVGSSATTTANISKTTMSGLIMLPSGRRFDTTIIPLNTTRFIVIGDGGGSSFTSQLAKTVAPTNAVIDEAVQATTLQAEANAYSNIGVGDNTGGTVALIQPTITSMKPNSGGVGSSVTITGNGFTATGNKIQFGNLGVENNPKYIFNSSDEKTITFTVPLSNFLACWASGCEAPAYLTQPGKYEVSVINDNGTSNQVLFTVTP